MLPQFLYTLLMDVAKIRPTYGFAEYAQREPGFAQSSLQTYIAVFNMSRHTNLSHAMLCQIN